MFNVILGIKNATFKKGLEDSKRDLRTFGTQISGIGSGISSSMGKFFSVAAIGTAATSVVNFAGDLRDNADAAGINVEAMEKLQGAFSTSGANSEIVTRGVANMTQVMSEALKGNQDAIESFEGLGVSLNDIVEKSEKPEEMMFALADGFSKAVDKGQALSDLQDILGKSAKRMSAGMRAGGDDLRKSFTDSEAATEEQINAVDNLGDSISRFFRKAKTMGVQIAAGLMGKGPKFNLDSEDPVKVEEERKKAEAARQGMLQRQEMRFMESQRRDREKRQREEAPKKAAEMLREEQRAQDAIEKAQSSVSHRAGQTSLRQRIADAARLSIGTGVGAAKAKADLAEGLSQRRDALINRNLMTPSQRREERRDDLRRERAARKADRQLKKEFEEDVRKKTPASDKDSVKPSVEKGNGILTTINTTLVNRLVAPSN